MDLQILSSGRMRVIAGHVAPQRFELTKVEPARSTVQDSAAIAEYSVGLEFALERGWVRAYESGTFARVTAARTELLV